MITRISPARRARTRFPVSYALYAGSGQLLYELHLPFRRVGPVWGDPRQGHRSHPVLTFGPYLVTSGGLALAVALPTGAEGVAAMRLTWKDAVSTVFMAAIVVIYIALLNSTTAWLISSARGTAAAVLVLGMVGGCGMSATAGQYQGARTRAYTSLANVLGATALVAGVIALITASAVALAVLVMATLTLWLVATVRHTFSPPAGPSGGRDMHEVIHPEKSGH